MLSHKYSYVSISPDSTGVAVVPVPPGSWRDSGRSLLCGKYVRMYSLCPKYCAYLYLNAMCLRHHHFYVF